MAEPQETTDQAYLSQYDAPAESTSPDYPNGPLRDDEDGSVYFNVEDDHEAGEIQIGFQQPVMFARFTPDQANELGNLLIQKAAAIRQGIQDQTRADTEATVQPDPEKGPRNGEMRLEIAEIAHVCHEANRSYCEALGDKSQPTWEGAPLWQRQSAIQGVANVLKMMSRGVSPERMPEESHHNWVQHKRDAGWRYGEEKDPEAKRHPCLVPFHELPLSQQIKDTLFVNVVLSFCQPNIVLSESDWGEEPDRNA